MAPPPTTTPHDDATIVVLGKFRLLELIGRGGMGEVWRAEALQPGRVAQRAAVKRMRPEFAESRDFLSRFTAEARITARLEHANIVRVLEYGETPEPYIALEYVEGANVAQLFHHCEQHQTRLPPAAAMYIVAMAARALEYAHQKRDDSGAPLNIVHRDVSLANLLVSREGTVKVLDFGIAKALDNSIVTPASELLGKFRYMAPERVTGTTFDRRADVFSLGVVLWELIVGERLLPQKAQAEIIQALVSGDFRRPSERDARVTPEIDRVVMATLATDPARRTESAGALSEALLSLVHAISPGFDDAELARVLSTLLPSVWPPGAPPRPDSMRWPVRSIPATEAMPEPRPILIPPLDGPAPPRRSRAAWFAFATVGLLGLAALGAALLVGRWAPDANVGEPPRAIVAADAATIVPDATAAPPPPVAVAGVRAMAPPDACATCGALAVRALDAAQAPVRQCMMGARTNVSATVAFDNATGRATDVALAEAPGAALPERLRSCVRTGLMGARFTPPPSAGGVTRVARTWLAQRVFAPK